MLRGAGRNQVAAEHEEQLDAQHAAVDAQVGQGQTGVHMQVVRHHGQHRERAQHVEVGAVRGRVHGERRFGGVGDFAETGSPGASRILGAVLVTDRVTSCCRTRPLTHNTAWPQHPPA